MADSSDRLRALEQDVRETRIAIDVLFEALAHVQASFERGSEDERAESCALYKRYEYLLDQESDLDVPSQADDAPDAVPDASSADASPSGEGTLEKLWPDVPPPSASE